MFLHTHPYEPFLFPDATKLIVGTLPPPRFTTRELKEGDVDFCYGSRDGQLWRILDRIFQLKLRYETTRGAVEQRTQFLKQRGIGICDIVASAERAKVDATDLGMKNIVLRDLIRVLYEFPNVSTLIFTGGNSKNGPEYFFRRHIKTYGLKLIPESDTVPRIHTLRLPKVLTFSTQGINGEARVYQSDTERTIKTISLTAPSGSANRAIGSMKDYQAIKNKNLEFNTFDYRVKQYEPFF